MGDQTYLLSLIEVLLEPDSPVELILDSFGHVWLLRLECGRHLDLRVVERILELKLLEVHVAHEEDAKHAD